VLVATVVVLAISIVSLVAFRSLRDLAEAEAIVRVELAVAAGRETLRAWVRDVEVAASLLAERPTLIRLMYSAEHGAISDYLQQYCSGAELDICAAISGGLVSKAPVSSDIGELLSKIESSSDGGELLADSRGTFLAAGIRRLDVSGPQDVFVLVARRIDEQAVGELSDQAGLRLSLTGVYSSPSDYGELAPFAGETLSSGAAASGRLNASGDFVASLKISNPAGIPIAVLHARLARGAAMQPVAAIGFRIIAAGLIVAVLAMASAVLVGRHWAGGVARLTESARTLRAGDLSKAIQEEPGRELSILSKMMEDMRRAMAELEVARRTRDTVLANISHEFRSPLAAQLASIELLRDEFGNRMTKEERDLVVSLERGTKRLTRLIDNLLESVRIEAGQLDIRRQQVNLSSVVTDAVDLIEPLIQQRNQMIRAEEIDSLPLIEGDHQRLTQVFVNLLANAGKFGRAGGTIRVGGEMNGNNDIVVWVDDDGPGPVDEDEGVLFSQFRRSSGPDPEQSGLGLGLYIVKSIVERHGGRVRLNRTADATTRATVELPIRSANEDSDR